MVVQSKEDIAILRVAGKRLASVLTSVAAAVSPGVAVRELDALAERLIKEGGDTPVFLGYQPDGAERPFPASLCVSVNDEVVHGIPNERERVLVEGDIVGLDLGLSHEGYIVDSARTVPVGAIDAAAEKLMSATKGALMVGIAAAKVGNRVGDIGAAIEAYVKPFGYGIVRELGGHGVGRKVHELPYIPNYGKAGRGEKLVEGMVLALEPMLNEGTEELVIDEDGYTYKTADGKRSAHFEHTILLTKNGPEILTA